MGLTTIQAEPEFARDIPIRLSTALPTLRADLHVFGDMVFERTFDFGLCLRQVQPRLGQVLNAPLIGLSHIRRTQEAVSGVVVVVSGNVVNLARGVLLRGLACAPHRVVLLPAITAKVNRVQLRALLLPARCKALGIQRDVTLTSWLQRGKHFARATDELVQLEREGRAALRSLDIVGSYQEALQARHGFFRGALRISGQQIRSIF